MDDVILNEDEWNEIIIGFKVSADEEPHVVLNMVVKDESMHKVIVEDITLILEAVAEELAELIENSPEFISTSGDPKVKVNVFVPGNEVTE